MVQQRISRGSSRGKSLRACLSRTPPHAIDRSMQPEVHRGCSMRDAILAVLAAVLCVSGAAWAQTKAPSERAVLFEENKTPAGARVDGVATWSIENAVSPGSGDTAELAVKAVVAIPDRQMTVTWSLQRNKDKSLPASHLIEVMFKLPADAPGGDVDRMPGILMKSGEMAKGTPLAGVGVKVEANFFVFGLSAAGADSDRNVELLENLDWIDIPMVHSDGHRAILAVAKGESGRQAFDAAFAAWNDSSPAKTAPK
jgi:hypothetical protein